MQFSVYEDLHEGLKSCNAFDADERSPLDRIVIREILYDIFVTEVLHEGLGVDVTFGDDVNQSLVNPKFFYIQGFEVSGSNRTRYDIDIRAVSGQYWVENGGLVYEFEGSVSQLSDNILARRAHISKLDECKRA